jgi:hypothetical protein
MTEGEITAAYDSVVAALGMMTDLMGGNLTVIFAVFTVTAVVGVLAFLIRAMFAAVDLRKIP